MTRIRSKVFHQRTACRVRLSLALRSHCRQAVAQVVVAPLAVVAQIQIVLKETNSQV